jgi:hypothetical protein
LTNSFQLYTANFSGIYALEFRANAGSKWFSIDSITLNASSTVPEPRSGLLLVLGVLAIAGLSRLRARA